MRIFSIIIGKISSIIIEMHSKFVRMSCLAFYSIFFFQYSQQFRQLNKIMGSNWLYLNPKAYYYGNELNAATTISTKNL